jgi:hypothetical protein
MGDDRLGALKALTRPVRRALQRPFFRGSIEFWERTYRRGGDSGSGSSGELAAFKADVVNGIVAELGIESVVELGVGDGRQLALASYPRYVGLDVSEAAIARCAASHEQDATKSFMQYNPRAFHDRIGVLRADLALSLDTIYHVVEDDLWELYLTHLFALAGRVVVIYAPDGEPSTAVPYSKPRAFTPWIERHRPEWALDRTIKNPHPQSWSDFYVFLKRDDAAAS